jgi:hypothetical protein
VSSVAELILFNAVQLREACRERYAVIRACKVCGRMNRIPAAHLADTGRCGACKASLPPVDEPLEVDRQ